MRKFIIVNYFKFVSCNIIHNEKLNFGSHTFDEIIVKIEF